MWQRIARDDACEWCKDQQGQGNNHRDIEFARHVNCKCVIINTRAGKVYTGEKVSYFDKDGVLVERTNQSWKNLSPEDFQNEINNSLTNVLNVFNKGFDTTIKLSSSKQKLIMYNNDYFMKEKATPGKGQVVGKFSDANKAVALREQEIADWIVETYGGVITPIEASVIEGVKSADSLWKSKLFNKEVKLEFKSSNGSKSSINYQVRKASKQIDKDDVLFIHLEDEIKRDTNDILNDIKRQCLNYEVNNVIVVHQKKTLAFFKTDIKK